MSHNKSSSNGKIVLLTPIKEQILLRFDTQEAVCHIISENPPPLSLQLKE